MKKILTEWEFMQIRNLVCAAVLDRDAEHKQYFLIEIVRLLTGSKKKFLDSAKDQGYNISKGIKP